MEIINCFCDGSYGKNNLTYCASWAFIIIKEDKIIHKDKGILYGEINSMRQIGGEMQSVIEGIKYCKLNNFKGNFHIDYIGLRNWIYDLFDKKPWKTNNKWTQNYRNFCLENREYINKMIKVKAHSGNTYNEMVDELAKI